MPRYDFNWQTYYLFKEPLQVPKDNPNSKAEVKWGDQTWEEMQYTGMLFSPVVPPKPVTDTKPGGER